MTDDPFGIPQEFSDALNEGLKQESGIQLPFTAPLMWLVNGSAQNRAIGKSSPALYFGGWMMQNDHMDDAAQEFGEIPSGFVQTDFVNHKGDVIPGYSARAVVMVPMSYRVAWVPKRENGGFGVRYTTYQQGTSMHVQMLALLATTTPQKTYKPWGPVILSAKSYQAGNLLDAVKGWSKLIAPVLRQVGSKAPASSFWMGVGTFGEFSQKMVGKTGAQSPITPITLYQPPTVDVDLLKKLFVGKDTAGQMADYLAQAAEWLNAWKAPVTAPAGGPAEPEWPIDEPTDDQIPF